jgi:hypothetical protein
MCFSFIENKVSEAKSVIYYDRPLASIYCVNGQLSYATYLEDLDNQEEYQELWLFIPIDEIDLTIKISYKKL